MPSTSQKQKNFMHVVYAMQHGKMAKSGKAGKAADEMNPEDVKDFLMQECGLKECGVSSKQRILKVLRGLKDQEQLREEESVTPNVVASTKTAHGDFDQTLKMYRGFEFTPKENQAIQNFDEAQPSVHDKFKVQYAKSDDFTNNSTIVVKKLRQPDGKYVYTAFVKVRGGEDEAEQPPAEPPHQGGSEGAPAGEAPPQGGEMVKEAAGDEIKIIKSTPIDGVGGEEILTNFLQAVYHNQA